MHRLTGSFIARILTHVAAKATLMRFGRVRGDDL